MKTADFAAMGGDARALALTKDERRTIARQAAEARWMKAGKPPIPRALRVGSLRIGEIEFECAVLDDESHTRVVSETNFMEAMGMYRSGALSTRRSRAEGKSAPIPLSLAYKNIKPYVDKHLGSVHFSPLRYVTPEGRLVSVGLPALIIPKICEVWIDADRDGKFNKFPRQKAIAHRADILHRGFALVGIIALIDEATKWQDDRARDALAQILEAFVATELRPYVKTFPIDYYKELCRLRNVPFPQGKMRLPSYFGHITNDIIYSRLAPGVLADVQEKNPVVKTPTSKKGYRKNKNFQWLTDDIGSPKLNQHMAGTVTLMKACPDGAWDMFKGLLDRALPPYADLPLLRALEEADQVPALSD